MTMTQSNMIEAAGQPVRKRLRRLRRSRSLTLGSCLVLLVVLAALLAPLLAPYDPVASNFRGRLIPPGMEHWFGTDHFGRDLFSRILYGARISFLIGGCVVLFNARLRHRDRRAGRILYCRRWCADAIHGRSHGVPGHPARHCHQRRAGRLDPQRRHRLGHRHRALHGASRPCLGAGATRDGVCRGGKGARRQRNAHIVRTCAH